MSTFCQSFGCFKLVHVCLTNVQPSVWNYPEAAISLLITRDINLFAEQTEYILSGD